MAFHLARQHSAYLRSLPFDERLARLALAEINAGPDGLESLRQSQCDMRVVQVMGKASFHDDSKLLTTKSSSLSRLLSLPRKVRQSIYAYVVTYPEPIPIRIHSSTTTKWDGNTTTIRSWYFTPSLLRTCRKIEKDATPLFYANNAFKAELTDGDPAILHTWLRDMDPSYLALVPQLIINMNPQSCFDVQTLRHDDMTGRMHIVAGELAKAILKAGISSDRVQMVSPVGPGKHLLQDAALLGPLGDVGDTRVVVDQWFEELQGWFTYEEYDGPDEREEEEEAEEEEEYEAEEENANEVTPGVMEAMGRP